MKNMRKILAALMALAMVCGTPVALNGTAFDTAVYVGAEPLEDTSATTPQTDSSQYMTYTNTRYAFDVMGINEAGGTIQTTYGNAGFRTYMQVGDGGITRLFPDGFAFGKVVEEQGVQLSITPKFTGSGKGVVITYSLYNSNEEAVDLKLGSAGDTTINGNDRNTVELTDSGVKMFSGDVVLYLIPGNASFTTKWVGKYSSDTYGSYVEHVFDDGVGEDYYVGADSAMCWSWTLHLEPGQNRTLTSMISVADEAADTYECTFDPANGEETFSTRVMDGDSVMQPDDPVMEGYVFKYWTADGVNAYDFSTVLTADLTLTAVYAVKQSTITFNTDGGSYIAPITQDPGTDVAVPAAPEKDGYTFVGWDTEIPATMPAEDMTITALWIENAVPEEVYVPVAVSAPKVGTGGIGSGEQRNEDNYTWSAKVIGGTISWDTQPGAEKYIISARKKGDTQWKRVGITEDTEFDLSSMEKGTYTFLVRYVKGDFKAPARLSARTEAAVGANKAALTAKADEDGYVILKWNAVDGAEKYRVFRVEDGKLKKIGTTSKTSARVNGTAGDKFAVRAYVDGKWTKVTKADIVTVK